MPRPSSAERSSSRTDPFDFVAIAATTQEGGQLAATGLFGQKFIEARVLGATEIAPPGFDPITGRAEFRCDPCGYGAISDVVPPRCPMCQASAWAQLPWQPCPI